MPVEKLLDECVKLFREDRFHEAIDACNEILKVDLNNQRALGYKARSLYFLKECDEALKLLNNAIILYPKNYHYYYIKSEVLMDKGEYDKAIGCFEKIFEIGLPDETALAFMKMDYSSCLNLKIEQSIEREKYVEAWNCFNQQLKIKSNNLKRPQAIERFKILLKRHTTRGKYRQYHVKISSNEAKSKLIKFLKENGFKSDDESGLMFLIDVIDKTYGAISVDEIGYSNIISESKFYDKVNYYPRDEIVRREIFDERGNLLYEGYALHNAPYGFGIAYFENGTIYREGIFDIKGIVQGKEYYPSGRLRFEGKWSLTTGYGPNAPWDGNAYGEDGELIYSGKFEIKRGGVGWPMIQKPKGFPLEQKERPKIEFYR